MEWVKPRVTVVDMNAEIGSYQPDFDDGAERPLGESKAGARDDVVRSESKRRER